MFLTASVTEMWQPALSAADQHRILSLPRVQQVASVMEPSAASGNPFADGVAGADATPGPSRAPHGHQSAGAAREIPLVATEPVTVIGITEGEEGGGRAVVVINPGDHDSGSAGVRSGLSDDVAIVASTGTNPFAMPSQGITAATPAGNVAISVDAANPWAAQGAVSQSTAVSSDGAAVTAQAVTPPVSPAATLPADVIRARVPGAAIPKDDGAPLPSDFQLEAAREWRRRTCRCGLLPVLTDFSHQQTRSRLVTVLVNAHLAIWLFSLAMPWLLLGTLTPSCIDAAVALRVRSPASVSGGLLATSYVLFATYFVTALMAASKYHSVVMIPFALCTTVAYIAVEGVANASVCFQLHSSASAYSVLGRSVNATAFLNLGTWFSAILVAIRLLLLIGTHLLPRILDGFVLSRLRRWWAALTCRQQANPDMPNPEAWATFVSPSGEVLSSEVRPPLCGPLDAFIHKLPLRHLLACWISTFLLMYLAIELSDLVTLVGTLFRASRAIVIVATAGLACGVTIMVGVMVYSSVRINQQYDALLAAYTADASSHTADAGFHGTVAAPEGGALSRPPAPGASIVVPQGIAMDAARARGTPAASAPLVTPTPQQMATEAAAQVRQHSSPAVLASCIVSLCP